MRIIQNINSLSFYRFRENYRTKLFAKWMHRTPNKQNCKIIHTNIIIDFKNGQ